MQLGDLFEARSNPDKNQRQHILTELTKYAGQKDIFLSFTASFDTHVSPTKLTGGTTDVRAKGGQNKIGMNPKSKYETPLGIYTYPVDYILDYSKRNNGLAAPFTGATKWGFLYVLRRSTNNFADDSTNIAPFFEKLHDLAIDILEEVEGNKLVGEAISTAYQAGNQRSQFWNLARLLADASLKSGVFGKTAPVAWNVIMRRIGLDAFIDDAGLGIIHSNEPTQAVFFTAQAFRVVDCIQSSNEHKNAYYTRGQISKQMKDRKLNVNTINPLMLRSIFTNETVTVEDINWVAERLAPVQRRIVNESFDHWPNGLSFGTEALNAMRKFGPVPTKMLIETGTGHSSEGKIEDWPEWFGRMPTKKEWAGIFNGYAYNGQDANMKLFMAKAPWIDGEFLANTFTAKENPKFPDFGIIQHCAEKNGVPMEGKLLEEAFVRYPSRAVESYPDHKWSFAQWYRALRTNVFDDKIGEVVPLEVAMPILMRDDRNNFMSRSLMKRLITEKPEFMALWFPAHGSQYWHQSYPELLEFIAKYLPVMAARNPEMLRFVRTKGTKPDERLLKVIWRDFKKQTDFSMRTMQWALENHWITQEDFTKHLDPRLAPLATDWENYGWGYIEDDLFVDAMVMSGEIDRLKADHIPTLMRRHPEKMRVWEGSLTATDARELFEEYPECRENYSVLHALTAPYIYDFWKKGMLPFANIFSNMQYRIIAASCMHDDTTFAKLNDPNGPFNPVPLDPTLWRHNVSVETLVAGGCFGEKCNHHLAMALYSAYQNNLFPDLQLIVSERTMQWLAQENPRVCVMTHPFGNPIPDAMLTPLQNAYIDKGMANYGHNLDEVDMKNMVRMLFSKIAKPTQAVRTKYAKYLQA